jgi:prepilin-type processing-associated H-X9-DG protein
VIYYPSDYGFNINEGLLTGGTAAYPGVTAGSQAFGAANPTFGFNSSTTLAQLATPTTFLIIADAARADGALCRGSLTPQYINSSGAAQSYTTDITPGFPASQTQAAAVARHNGGLNVGYSDGHVKFRKLSQLYVSATDNDFRYDSTGQ